MIPVKFAESNVELILHTSMASALRMPAQIIKKDGNEEITVTCWEFSDLEMQQILLTKKIWIAASGEESCFQINLQNPYGTNG